MVQGIIIEIGKYLRLCNNVKVYQTREWAKMILTGKIYALMSYRWKEKVWKISEIIFQLKLRKRK